MRDNLKVGKPKPLGLRALVIAGLLAMGAAGACETRVNVGLPTGTLKVRTSSGQVDLHVEIASSGEQRGVGLMNRGYMDPDAGMVFLFEEPRSSGFWMKDTLIPLSIAFWDGRGRLVAMLDMEPCRKDPCPSYYPEASYEGAVEVNQGWFEAHGVEVGDTVELVTG